MILACICGPLVPLLYFNMKMKNLPEKIIRNKLRMKIKQVMDTTDEQV